MENKEKEQQVIESTTEAADKEVVEQPKEFGGPQGLEPTRYGDWERKGICVDF